MYYVQVQMLKNALMSWRWDSILRILGVLRDTSLPPDYLCALRIFGPQHDTHVEKDDIEQRAYVEACSPHNAPSAAFDSKV